MLNSIHTLDWYTFICTPDIIYQQWLNYPCHAFIGLLERVSLWMHMLAVFFISVQQNYYCGKWEVTELIKLSTLHDFLLFHSKDFMQLITHHLATGFQTPNRANLPLNNSEAWISSSEVANRIEGLQCSLLLLFCTAMDEKYMYEIWSNARKKKHQEYVVGKTVLERIKCI